MTLLWIGVGIGVLIGWQMHVLYLRRLFKIMVRIRRQLRGGK